MIAVKVLRRVIHSLPFIYDCVFSTNAKKGKDYEFVHVHQ